MYKCKRNRHCEEIRRSNLVNQSHCPKSLRLLRFTRNDAFKFMLTLLISLSPSLSYAQITQEERINQHVMDAEQARNAEIMRIIEQGANLMEEGDYIAANLKFKDVLKQTKVVPSDLCYFFGKNSYHLNKYRQSIDWLTKYIQLKGTQGQYYETTVTYLEKAKKALIGVKKEEHETAKIILSSDYDIDCGPSGKVVCPVCKGSGVIIEKGIFENNTYKACPYSDKDGNLTCVEYNQLLRGELKPKF